MAKKETSNDNVILDLKKQIADKKKALAGITGFKPSTNCSLLLDDSRLNLHAARPDQLRMALVKLNALRLSAIDLGIELVIDGFKVEVWMEDVSAKLAVLDKSNEEARLRALESKLTELLSHDKKTELLLSELKDQI